MNENNIKKAAELLLNGAKMLSIACPQCNDPIYELKDESLFCISCSAKLIHEGMTNDDNSSRNDAKIHTSSSNNPIQIKINKLSKELMVLEDHNEILKLAELISKLQKLL